MNINGHSLVRNVNSRFRHLASKGRHLVDLEKCFPNRTATKQDFVKFTFAKAAEVGTGKRCYASSFVDAV